MKALRLIIIWLCLLVSGGIARIPIVTAQTWPTLPAFSANNFLDHFTGSSLNARWSSFTSNTGAVTVTDSYVDCNAGADADSAAAIYYNTKLDKTKSQLWTICVNRVQSGPVDYFWIVNKATAPVADTYANIGAITRIRAAFNDNDGTQGFGVQYYDAGHTEIRWNGAGSAWDSTTTNIMYEPTLNNDYYILGFEIDGPNSKWRMMGWGRGHGSGYSFDQGWRLFGLTDWVPWSSLETSTDLWLILGNPYNKNDEVVECKYEWVCYAETNTPLEAWAAAKASVSETNHTIRRYYSYDGLTFVPQDRTTDALGPGPGDFEDLEVQEPCLVNSGTTDYMFYACTGTASFYNIGVATAPHKFPQVDTWTRSPNNPILAPGDGEIGYGFPFVVKDLSEADANKRWKMLYSVQSAADFKWRLAYATAPDPPDTSTWTRQGIVLDVGDAGTADETSARNGVAVWYNNQWEVWYEGHNAADVCSLMRATGTDLGTLTKDGAGSRYNGATATASLTGDLTGNLVTVDSTQGFVPDAQVIFDQDASSADYSVSRIRKILSSTEVELYHGLDGFTTTTPAKMRQKDASPNFSPRCIIQVGTEWWFFMTTWGWMDDLFAQGYGALCEDTTLYTHSDAAPSGATPAMNYLASPVIPRGFNNDSRSVENMSLLLPPKPAATTAVTLSDFSARSYDDGRVLVQWRSGTEVDNLGYNVYREQDGQRTRVTPQLIAGSALIAGAKSVLTAGKSYAWVDSPPATAQPAVYWLEDLDLNGKSNWHGPAQVEYSPGKRPSIGQSMLISTLGFHQAQLSASLASSPLERRISATPTLSVSDAAQSVLAAQPAAKISVRHEGWYRVTQQELMAAGLDPKADPRTLQLFADGQEVPIKVTGEADGKLDPPDDVEFYGVGLDTPSTDTHVYWLVAGSQPGLRVSVATGKRGTAVNGGFPYTVERRDRSIYFSSLKNGDAENFFGAVVASQPVEQSLFLQHVDRVPSAAMIEVAMLGVTQVPHAVNLELNGVYIGKLTFAGESHSVTQLSVAQSLLRQGDNTIRMTARGGQSDISLVDYIHITYSHTYTADSNALHFTASGNQSVSVDGFTSAAVRMFDITSASSVREVSAAVKPTKNGYVINATVPGSGHRMLLALSDDQTKRAAAVAPNQPSSLRQPGAGADLLIITRRDFIPSIESLKSLREKQGLSVIVADIEDVYDEFSFGNKSAQALKDFLVYASRNWRTAPRFVLLAGDASVDPRNYLGYGSSDVVPTKLIDTETMETASDDWFADFGGKGEVAIAMGRLPVRTPEQASAMVAKIVSYESSASLDSVVLVSDANDGFDFEAANSQLRSIIPVSIRVEQINRGGADPLMVKSKLLAALNRGAKIVNYVGHGSLNQWRSGLLTSDDAVALTNGNRLPLVIAMTCLNGYFQDAVFDSLAESLMKAPRGGAVAVWGSSGMTNPANQSTIDEQVFKLIFQGILGHALTLGEATVRAKAAVSDLDVRRTWTLFGDPSLRLR